MIPATELRSTATQQAWEFEKPLQGGIVVGIDGSRESIAALNTAAGFARVWRCPLHVVSVLAPIAALPVSVDPKPNPENSETRRRNLRSSELDEIVRSLEPARDWTTEVMVGRPAREIVSSAEQRGAELVVLGRRHHGSIDRMFESETPLQVMRTTSVPVLTVEDELERPRIIVAAVDFSPSSQRAAKTALQLLKSAGTGTLYLVFVEPTDAIVDQFDVGDESRFPGDLVVWFRRFIDSLGTHPGILAEPVVLCGRTVQTLTDFSERVGADVIAAGSHSHGRIERFLLGSVSTGLVRTALCPVLVAPPGR